MVQYLLLKPSSCGGRNDFAAVVVLDRGRIAEVGSNRELLDGGGIYAMLHQMQFKE